MNLCRNKKSFLKIDTNNFYWGINYFRLEQRLTIICAGIGHLEVSTDFYEKKSG